MAASATLSNSEPNLQQRLRRDDDEDVIGMPTHVNKNDMPARTVTPTASPALRKRADQTVTHPQKSNAKISEESTKDTKAGPPGIAKESKSVPPGFTKPSLEVVPKSSVPLKPTSTDASTVSRPIVSNVVAAPPVAKSDDFPVLGQPGVVKKPETSDPYPPLGKPPPQTVVPSKKVEDFPSLNNSSVPVDKPLISSWNTAASSTKSKPAKKGKSWSQQSGREKLTKDEEFPALGRGTPASVTAPSATSFSASVTQVNRPGPSKPPPGITNIVNNSKNSSGSTRPPPGITPQHKNVPPGLQKKQGQPAKSPPGFDSKPVSTAQNEHEKKMERNLRLLAMLQSYLDEFNMTLFKNLSGDFRRGNKSAQEYYDGISELLGDRLKSVFSELVDLLPDETKRRELLRIHNDVKIRQKRAKELAKNAPKPDYTARSVWGAGTAPVAAKTKQKKPAVPNVLPHGQAESRCQLCGSTFPTEKSIEHMELHKETSFPSLPAAVQKKKTYNFLPTHTSQSIPVKSAWGK